MDKLKGAKGREIPPGLFAGGIALALAIIGWALWSASDLGGAKNPPGSPGNVDPYLSGPNSVLKKGGAKPPDTSGRPSPPPGAPR